MFISLDVALLAKSLGTPALLHYRKGREEGVSLQHIISRISKFNYNFPFNWNVPILVRNDYWTCQDTNNVWSVHTNKPPFTIMSSIFEVYGEGITL